MSDSQQKPERGRDILTKTLRRKKDRPEDLMLALRHECALTYESLGQAKRARSDFQRICAEDPDFEDVEQRLWKIKKDEADEWVRTGRAAP